MKFNQNTMKHELKDIREWLSISSSHVAELVFDTTDASFYSKLHISSAYTDFASDDTMFDLVGMMKRFGFSSARNGALSFLEVKHFLDQIKEGETVQTILEKHIDVSPEY